MTNPSNRKRAEQTNTGEFNPDEADLDRALAPLTISDASSAEPKPKRGRKVGSTRASLTEKLQKQRAEREELDRMLRDLERQAKQKTAFIVGRTVLDDEDPEFRALLLRRLRAAKLSAQDRAEIAHLFIEPERSSAP